MVLCCCAMLKPGKWYCRTPVTTLRLFADHSGEAASQLLYGEVVEVLDGIEGWSRVRADRDDYYGWVADACLAMPGRSPSHRVSQSAALVFTHPDIKSPLLQRLYFSSPLSLTEVEGDFYHLADGGFIHRRHVAPVALTAADSVTVALGFIGAPYLWGGRTCDGIDCSALVQTALLACGVACPRDTGDQRVAFGHTTASDMRRGDLVFFPGHVGIMVDDSNLLHANAHWMTTLVEPVAAVSDRLRSRHAAPILAIARAIQ